MFVILFDNGYALSETTNIGKMEKQIRILKTNAQIQNVRDGKLFDECGNEVTEYEDVTNFYIDLSNFINEIAYIGTPSMLNLPTGNYGIYRNGLLVVKFNIEEGQTKTIKFTEEGKYILIALDRPCNGVSINVITPSIIIE